VKALLERPVSRAASDEVRKRTNEGSRNREEPSFVMNLVNTMLRALQFLPRAPHAMRAAGEHTCVTDARSD